jgi:mono/diheme cytochrome c family protein
MSYAPLGVGQDFDAESRLYTAACGSCHYNSGRAPLAVRPDLALNTAVNLPEPTNLIQVILRGISAKDGLANVVMPSFAEALSDADIGRIAAYLRRTRTNLPPWPKLADKIADLRRQTSARQ